MNMNELNITLILIFSGSFLFSVMFGFLSLYLSRKFNILDCPKDDRRLHKKPTPLLGGLGIFLSFFLMLFLISDKLVIGNLEYSHWLLFFLGATLLLIGGVLDDKYNLKPIFQIIWPILAVLLVILGGINIEKITNPFGGYLILTPIISSIIIFLWILGMTYTTKLLDGVDGLVSGVVLIGACIIFLFTVTEKYYQPDIAYVSLVLVGVCAGFLVLNWHPAKIFLGESGSLLLGYILGVLAIISGGKIAIALLVMALPLMDVVWTIIRRIRLGKNPFCFADRKHLHHRLLDLGLGQRKTVLIYYFFASFFGLLAIFMQSSGKIFTLLFLIFIMIFIVFGFNYLDRRHNIKQ